MKYITKEVRIGIAGIAALCILVYGINYLKGINMCASPLICRLSMNNPLKSSHFFYCHIS